jgi:hypothetical protein
VTIEEARELNLLIMPPWDQRDEIERLVATLSGLDSTTSVWLRCKPEQGQECQELLASVLREASLPEGQIPNFLLVDARLAPEREAGLYRAASAVYVEDHWIQSPLTIRRASDCSSRLLRGPAALEAWRTADG